MLFVSSVNIILAEKSDQYIPFTNPNNIEMDKKFVAVQRLRPLTKNRSTRAEMGKDFTAVGLSMVIASALLGNAVDSDGRNCMLLVGGVSTAFGAGMMVFASHTDERSPAEEQEIKRLEDVLFGEKTSDT
jgi:hypothetical protein